MCTVSAVLGSAQAGVNFALEDKAARDAIKYSEANAKVIGDAAVEDAVAKFSQLNLRGIQESDAASRQIQAISREARRATGNIKATSGASGAQGNSVEALTRDFEAQELTRIEIVRKDLEAGALQRESTGEGITAEAEQRIFNAQGPAVQGPSIFNALFSIGSSVLGGVADAGYFTEDQTPK